MVLRNTNWSLDDPNEWRRQLRKAELLRSLASQMLINLYSAHRPRGAARFEFPMGLRPRYRGRRSPKLARDLMLNVPNTNRLAEQNQFTVAFPLVDVYVELSTVSWNVTYG
jgi:hypothetical protein